MTCLGLTLSGDHVDTPLRRGSALDETFDSRGGVALARLHSWNVDWVPGYTLESQQLLEIVGTAQAQN